MAHPVAESSLMPEPKLESRSSRRMQPDLINFFLRSIFCLHYAILTSQPSMRYVEPVFQFCS